MKRVLLFKIFLAAGGGRRQAALSAGLAGWSLGGQSIGRGNDKAGQREDFGDAGEVGFWRALIVLHPGAFRSYDDKLIPGPG